jgi:hypothetical protein
MLRRTHRDPWTLALSSGLLRYTEGQYKGYLASCKEGLKVLPWSMVTETSSQESITTVFPTIEK